MSDSESDESSYCSDASESSSEDSDASSGYESSSYDGKPTAQTESSSSEDDSDDDDDSSSYEEVSITSSDNDSFAGDDSDSDDSDDDEPKARKPAKTVKKKEDPVIDALAGDYKPENEEALKVILAKTDKAVREPKPPKRTASIGRHSDLDESAHAATKAQEEVRRRRVELSNSQHSLHELQAQLEEDAKSMKEEFQNLELERQKSDEARKEIETGALYEKKIKKKKKEKGEVAGMSETKLRRESKRLDRERRLAEARERIEREEEEKQRKEREKAQTEKSASVDNSEDARRDRVYSWYSRMAMPSKKKFAERVAELPSSANVSEADVDLLPWNKSGTFVSVAKMNQYTMAKLLKK